MTNFKGTKGKWVVTSKDKVVRCEEGFTIVAPSGIIHANDWEANALLISKAPEMLEMLEILYQQVDFSFESFGSDTGIKMQEKIKQLIKEATEL